MKVSMNIHKLMRKSDKLNTLFILMHREIIIILTIYSIKELLLVQFMDKDIKILSKLHWFKFKIHKFIEPKLMDRNILKEKLSLIWCLN